MSRDEKQTGCLFVLLQGFCCFISVPAAVVNLTLSNTGTTHLNITWSPAPGDVDHYEVRHLSSAVLFQCKGKLTDLPVLPGDTAL